MRGITEMIERAAHDAENHQGGPGQIRGQRRAGASTPAVLTEARRYYPDAQIELVRGARGKPGGVIVKRSPLLVPPKRGALGS